MDAPPTSGDALTAAPFKFTLRKDTRRWTPAERPRLAELLDKVAAIYDLPEGTKTKLKYTDVDGDMVRLPVPTLCCPHPNRTRSRCQPSSIRHRINSTVPYPHSVAVIFVAELDYTQVPPTQASASNVRMEESLRI